MLIEFSVSNYRSFKERVTLSMEATKIASQPPLLDEGNVIAANDKLRLLTSAALYGANASGKSNLIMALRFMRNFILSSSRETQVGEPILVEPYRLGTETESQPSEFEIIFLVEDVQYRYGFALTPERVVGEWLYRLGTKRETSLFSRENEAINVNTRSFREGRELAERTRQNALFLSVVAQFNGPVAAHLLHWFNILGVNLGVHDQGDMMQALHSFEHSSYGAAIEGLIQRLDVGISSLAFERGPVAMPTNVPREVAEQVLALFEVITKDKDGGELEGVSIKTYHRRFDNTGRSVDTVVFDLEQQESAGTRRLFTLAYPIVRALQEGLVLVVDEIDARIHPNLAIALIGLFNDPLTNPRHAQLIVTTHNTNLLSAKLFRRDQVWFIEKSRQGASDLYSLVEYRVDGKIVRNDASFEKDYIAGRYGAVPFIGDLGALLEATYGQEV